jgi:hypothetical protein
MFDRWLVERIGANRAFAYTQSGSPPRFGFEPWLAGLFTVTPVDQGAFAAVTPIPANVSKAGKNAA